ncbi:MAG: tail fiber domain-containing protein [Candidatus Taylorbacteria bacterium]
MIQNFQSRVSRERERERVISSQEFKIKLGGLVVVALFVIISLPSFVFASPLYTPGQTLNPSCLPTNPDCTVSPSAYTGMPSFGIGTTTPSQQLSVVGQQSIRRNSSTDNSIIISDSNVQSFNNATTITIGNNLTFTGSGIYAPDASVLIGNGIESVSKAGNSYWNVVVGDHVLLTANEPKNVVIGALAQASAGDGTAIGFNSRVGSFSMALGSTAQALGNFSAAIGPFASVTGDNIFGYGVAATRHWFAGTVGIGTTTPSSKLSITQSANTSAGGLWLSTSNNTDYRSMFMDTSGVLSFTGGDTAGVLNTATLNAAGAWTNASDIAYKENIVDLSTRYGLDTVLQTQPRFYTMKGDTHIPQVGFIAQELELVIPEVVDGEDGSKGISYGNLVAVAFQAIKELAGKLNDLMVNTIKAVTGTFTTVQTDNLCADDICINKDQLKALLIRAGGTITAQPDPLPPAPSIDPTTTTTPSTPSTPDPIATSTQPITDDPIPDDTASSTPPQSLEETVITDPIPPVTVAEPTVQGITVLGF